MRPTRRELLTMAAGAVAAPAAPARWNLLLITCDQNRADALGCMGNPILRTPNIDRLASQGALFENWFVQCPQCVPSRSALHTGRYPHTNRTPSNLYQLPPEEETLATALGRQGYLTACAGELPFAPTKFLGGFQQVVSADAEYHVSLEAAGWRGASVSAARRRLLEEHEALDKRQFQASPVPWPEDLDETAFHSGKAIEFLKANRERPFFLHVNFRRPHHPFDPPAPFDRLYQGARFPASHQRAGEMDNKPPGQRKAVESSVGFDLRTMTAADLDRIKAYYYGMISENDKYFGRMLDEMKAIGLEDRTIVVVTADHGEMLGDHGLLFKGGYMYDEVVHAPCVIRAPGRVPAGKRCNPLVEAIDLMPTLLELMGIQGSPRIQGRSLAPLMDGKSLASRPVHAEFSNIKMLRTRDWKLVHYLHAPYGELYNLREDPHELYNRYDAPGAARARQEMESAMIDWLVDSEDPARKPLQAEKR